MSSEGTPRTIPTLSENTMRRLALIRYLYAQGVQRSRQPEPLKALSILAFHDSSELFLTLACEVHGINARSVNITDYWDRLVANPPGVALAQKEPMRSLNSARNDLKHAGRLPSALDIEGYRATVTNFFNENMPVALGIVFDEISLEAVSKHLVDA